MPSSSSFSSHATALQPTTYTRPSPIPRDPHLPYKLLYKFSRMNTIAREGHPFFAAARCERCVETGEEACWVHWKSRKTCRGCVGAGVGVGGCRRPKEVMDEPPEPPPPPPPAPKVAALALPIRLQVRDTAQVASSSSSSSFLKRPAAAAAATGPVVKRARLPTPSTTKAKNKTASKPPSPTSSDTEDDTDDLPLPETRDAALRAFQAPLSAHQDDPYALAAEVKEIVQKLPELRARVVAKDARATEGGDEMMVRDPGHAVYLAWVLRRAEEFECERERAGGNVRGGRR